MTNIFSFIAERLVPAWVSTSFPIIRTILLCLIGVCSISLIVTVLMQSNSSSGGMNAISGAQESYYAQNKNHTREGRLKKFTIAAASTIAVSIVIFFISLLIYSGTGI